MNRSVFSRIGRPSSMILAAFCLLLLAETVPAVDPVITEPLAAAKLKSSLDLVYHSDAKGIAGRADLRIPAVEAPPSGYPIVVVVHGGAWMTGDKWTMYGFAEALADQGIASLTINYRHAPKFKYPSQVDDVRQALVWIHDLSTEYSFDQDRVGVFGYSAGGHLALLVATLANEKEAVQLVASQWTADDDRWDRMPAIRAVCAGGPPCDFTTTPGKSQIMSYFLGGRRIIKKKNYQSASPVTHVSVGDPPTRLLHGESDTLVPMNNSDAMKRSLDQVGVPCDLIAYPKLGHITTFLDPQAPVDMAEFFVEEFRGPRLGN